MEKVAANVLSEQDPQFTLETDQRYAAAIYGKVLRHSGSLRTGISQSLALLGGRPDPLTNCQPGAAELSAALTVRAVLKGADWRLWGGLNDLLPLLAEAAPTDFLDAVEAALVAKPCPFDTLFAQEGGGVGGRNYLTGLLWALETLAWDDRYLVRATLALAALAERDPGGQWSNRPANSLASIFLPWFPQTVATASKRLAAVRTLSKEYPAAAWKLLLRLLPGQQSTSTGTRKPQWRKGGPSEESPRPSIKEYWQEVEGYASMAVELATADPSKLQDVAARLDELPPASATRVLEHISSPAVTNLPEPERRKLWEVLSDLASKHRRFSDAEWAMPAAQVAEIESAATKVMPASPELRYQLLFGNREWDLYDRNKGDFKAQEEDLKTRRQGAINELIAVGGIGAVVTFAQSVQSPEKVGFALGLHGPAGAESQILPQLLLHADHRKSALARSFILGSFRRGGWGWVDSQDVSSWSPEQVAVFLISLPFESGAWERADRLLGNQVDLYWQQIGVFPFQIDAPISTVTELLLKHNRPGAAIDCLASAVQQKQPIDSKQAVRALLTRPSSAERVDAMHAYHVVVLIKHLQDDPNTDQEDLLKIEWAYLPALNEYNGGAPRTLVSRLSADPQFFCDVIAAVFRSKHEPQQDVEPTAEQQAKAKNAYQLLGEWDRVPGIAPDGTFSAQSFTQWMNIARDLAEKSGHLIIAMQQVGETLVHSPPDPDGLWIHRAIAEVLNRPDMDELRKGYGIGIFNSRGTYVVDPSGAQEKGLARKYRQQAEEIENAGFHRVADTLRKVADSYEREAARTIAEEAAEKGKRDE